jgi:hypothetical protein
MNFKNIKKYFFIFLYFFVSITNWTINESVALDQIADEFTESTNPVIELHFSEITTEHQPQCLKKKDKRIQRYLNLLSQGRIPAALMVARRLRRCNQRQLRQFEREISQWNSSRQNQNVKNDISEIEDIFQNHKREHFNSPGLSQ